MKTFKSLYIILVCILLPLQCHSYALNCFSEFYELTTRQGLSYGRNFSFIKYQNAKEHFANARNISLARGTEAEGPEEFLALYETYASRLKLDPLSEQIANEVLTPLQIRRIRRIKRLFHHENKGDEFLLDKYHVRDLVNDFYIMGITTNTEHLEKIKHHWRFSFALKDVLRKRFSTDLMSNGLEKSIKKSGNLKSDKLISRFRNWRKLYPNIDRVAISLLFNAYRIYLTGVPGSLPYLAFNKGRLISEELAIKVLRDGQHVMNDELLEKQYRLSLGAKRAYYAVNLLYTSIAYFVLGYFLFGAIVKKFKAGSKEEQEYNKKVEEEMSQFFSEVEVNLKKLEAWKTDFYEENKVYPSIEKQHQYFLELSPGLTFSE